jgi:hypothetical protein
MDWRYGKKKEVALLQHHLSPNQIKPNYLSSILQVKMGLG